MPDAALLWSDGTRVTPRDYEGWEAGQPGIVAAPECAALGGGAYPVCHNWFCMTPLLKC